MNQLQKGLRNLLTETESQLADLQARVHKMEQELYHPTPTQKVRRFLRSAWRHQIDGTWIVWGTCHCNTWRSFFGHIIANIKGVPF